MKHDATHEDRLVQLLTRPESAAALQDCGECRRKLDELRRLEGELRADATEAATLLAEAQAGASAADEEAVRQALEQARAARAGRRWRFRLLTLTLTLAAGLAAVLLLRERALERRPSPGREITLGGDFPVRIAVTAGRYDSIAWDCELSPGESFELSLAELEDGVAGTTLRTSAGLTSSSYALPAELEPLLPAELFVTVLVRDVQGLPRAQASATASRR